MEPVFSNCMFFSILTLNAHQIFLIYILIFRPDPSVPTFRAVKEIQQPLKRGDIVSITFENYSRNALPVNPKIYRVRLDLDWNEVNRSYSENISQSQKFNGTKYIYMLIPSLLNIVLDNTTNVFKSGKQSGYWSVKENIRKFLEEYARSLNLDPTDTDTWYSVTQAEIAQYKV
jgi:hypothetical protein